MSGLITRRAALRGFATLSAIGGTAAAAAPASHADMLGLPQETLDAYARQSSAETRLQHHLLCVAMTLDELHPLDTSRWFLTGGGVAGAYEPWFRVQRFDRYLDFSEPRCPKGMHLERIGAEWSFSKKDGVRRGVGEA